MSASASTTNLAASSTSSSSKTSKKSKKQQQTAQSAQSTLPPQSSPIPTPAPAHVNSNPLPEVGAVPNQPQVDGERQRGPVEEVIAKRLRQLGKKLQRYRLYAQQAPETLNEDQKATVLNLPALEGAYKELEQLVREKGPIDEQELIQAARHREAINSARTAALAEGAAQLDHYRQSIVTPLSLFLRLHTLLHPARPADHEHLTFGHLTLPTQLQDEVQATDVLRVARMWEDLTEGGSSAQSVLDGLVAGPKGDDEENDHIHHLLQLLATGPTSTEEEEPQPEVETAPVSRTESVNGAPETIAEVETAPQSEHGAPNGDAPEVTPQPEPAQTQMINFLQDDELEVADADEATGGIEEGYEVVPMLEPHQTSGSQRPTDQVRTYTPPSLDAPSPVHVQPPPPSFAPSTLNWADLDDEDDVSIAPPPAPADIAVEETFKEEEQPVIAIVQQNELAAEKPLSSPLAEMSTAVDSASPAPSAPQPRVPSGPSRGRGGRKQSQRPPKVEIPQSLPPPVGKVVVDEDGFEMKVRRAPPPTRGRGRGGSNGDGGGRVAGRGGIAGKGRPLEHQRSASGVQGKQDNQQGQQGQPKPSIFKSVQPTGPTSAPLIS